MPLSPSNLSDGLLGLPWLCLLLGLAICLIFSALRP
jgi:hypothetical protein